MSRARFEFAYQAQFTFDELCNVFDKSATLTDIIHTLIVTSFTEYLILDDDARTHNDVLWHFWNIFSIF